MSRGICVGGWIESSSISVWRFFRVCDISCNGKEEMLEIRGARKCQKFALFSDTPYEVHIAAGRSL